MPFQVLHQHISGNIQTLSFVRQYASTPILLPCSLLVSYMADIHLLESLLSPDVQQKKKSESIRMTVFFCMSLRWKLCAVKDNDRINAMELQHVYIVHKVSDISTFGLAVSRDSTRFFVLAHIPAGILSHSNVLGTREGASM